MSYPTSEPRIVAKVDVVVTDWGDFRLDDLVRQAREAGLGDVAEALKVLADEVVILKARNVELRSWLPRDPREPRWWEVWRKPSPGYGR